MEIGNDIKGQTRAVQIKSGQQIIPASSEADAQGPYVCFDIKWKHQVCHYKTETISVTIDH